MPCVPEAMLALGCCLYAWNVAVLCIRGMRADVTIDQASNFWRDDMLPDATL
eukprot:COSAG02_NODE_5367_length_4395_cov_5.334963_2_plen_52_part_00